MRSVWCLPLSWYSLMRRWAVRSNACMWTSGFSTSTVPTTDSAAEVRGSETACMNSMRSDWSLIWKQDPKRFQFVVVYACFERSFLLLRWRKMGKWLLPLGEFWVCHFLIIPGAVIVRSGVVSRWELWSPTLVCTNGSFLSWRELSLRACLKTFPRKSDWEYPHKLLLALKSLPIIIEPEKFSEKR